MAVPPATSAAPTATSAMVSRPVNGRLADGVATVSAGFVTTSPSTATGATAGVTAGATASCVVTGGAGGYVAVAAIAMPVPISAVTPVMPPTTSARVAFFIRTPQKILPR